MHKDTAEPASSRAYVARRRAWIQEVLGRPIEPGAAAALPAERLQFLRREAEDLYSNELAWEELTDKEVIHGGHLTEMVFPGFLAFVDGLLAPQPHPDAVEHILRFLDENHARMSDQTEAGADSRQLVWARAMTSYLIDLVLYRLLDLSREEREIVDAAR